MRDQGEADPFARKVINVGGTDVSVRALSRAEAVQFNALKYRTLADPAADAALEVFLLMCGTGCTEEEAKAFRQGNDVKTVGLLIDGIIALTEEVLGRLGWPGGPLH